MIALLLVSAFVVILNETILSVALPPIMADLDLSELTAQWLTATVVLLPIYLQLVLGLSTLTVGAMMLAGGLVMGLAAPAVGRMFDRVGPRPLLTPGLGLVVVGALVMCTVGTVQQVAGAAGAAMLVALMPRIAAGIQSGGGSHAQGVADGTSLAFLISAALGVVTIAISLFIRRNPQQGAADPSADEEAPAHAETPGPA